MPDSQSRTWVRRRASPGRALSLSTPIRAEGYRDGSMKRKQPQWPWRTVGPVGVDYGQPQSGLEFRAAEHVVVALVEIEDWEGDRRRSAAGGGLDTPGRDCRGGGELLEHPDGFVGGQHGDGRAEPDPLRGRRGRVTICGRTITWRPRRSPGSLVPCGSNRGGAGRCGALPAGCAGRWVPAGRRTQPRRGSRRAGRGSGAPMPPR
jgi:hypothetical protein